MPEFACFFFLPSSDSVMFISRVMFRALSTWLQAGRSLCVSWINQNLLHKGRGMFVPNSLFISGWQHVPEAWMSHSVNVHDSKNYSRFHASCFEKVSVVRWLIRLAFNRQQNSAAGTGCWVWGCLFESKSSVRCDCYDNFSQTIPPWRAPGTRAIKALAWPVKSLAKIALMGSQETSARIVIGK